MMKKGVLNKAQLQMIAAAAMLLDHTAVFAYANPILYYIMHIIGRTTIVIMCYFVAEGYHKTHDIYKYIIRMGIFAAVSQIPFYLYHLMAVPQSLYSFCAGNYTNRNVIFTLFCGLCILTVLKSEFKPVVKLAAFCAALYVTRNSDWSQTAILLIIVFGCIRNNKRMQLTAAAAVLILRMGVMCVGLASQMMSNGFVYLGSIFWLAVQAGGFLALPLIALYNGNKGRAPRLGLYIFYPLHFIIIYIAELIIFGFVF